MEIIRDNSLRTLSRPTPSICRSNFPDQWNDLKWLVSQRQKWLQSGSWSPEVVCCPLYLQLAHTTYKWQRSLHGPAPLSAAFTWCAREHKSQKPHVYFQELRRLCSESVVLTQLSSVAQSCPTLCDPMDCSIPGFPVYYHLLEPAQTHVHWVWCHPTISSSVVPFSSHLQSFPRSVFSNESVLRMRWPKYWSFSFSISPSNEYSGLISFRMDWLDLLAVQGTLKSGPYYEKSFKWTMLGTQQ